jgi:hypothetical protein
LARAWCSRLASGQARHEGSARASICVTDIIAMGCDFGVGADHEVRYRWPAVPVVPYASEGEPRPEARYFPLPL